MKEKWILPLRPDEGEVWTVTNDSRLDKTLKRAIQAESDLTDALDMLESLIDDTFSNRTHIARKQKIELFINRFKHPTP